MNHTLTIPEHLLQEVLVMMVAGVTLGECDARQAISPEAVKILSDWCDEKEEFLLTSYADDES